MRIQNVRLTASEFYNMRALAMQNNVPITHRWKDGGVSVKVDVSFLIQYEYLDMIKF